MKMLLILWAIGLTTCDKLDRTYLPPPGSVTAGGNPGDLELPLEFPKEKYPSTLQPGEDLPSDDNSLKPNFSNVAFGIDRQGPQVTSAESFTTRPVDSFSANTFRVPTTTTSYASSQTTTLPPTENYETTGAAVSTHGYPSTTFSFDSNSNYPQTHFVDINIPGTFQDNGKDRQLSTVISDNTPESKKNRQGVQQTYPTTQYGFDKISGDSTASPDNYYNEQSSATSKPHKTNQIGQKNQLSYPELQENFNGVNDNQDTYDPTNILLPNQFTRKHSSLPNSVISSTSEYASTPSANVNFGATYERTRPERIQADADRNAVILNYDNILTPEGFAYSFDTTNGIHADESGTAIDGVKAEGSYSYTGDDGKVYRIVYTADENGFQPRGDHLPTAPPIPEAILKAIQQAKQSGVFDDGSYDDAKYGHGRYQGLMDRLPQLQPTNIGKKGNNLNYGPEEIATGIEQNGSRHRNHPESNIINGKETSSITEEKLLDNAGNADLPKNKNDALVSINGPDVNNQGFNLKQSADNSNLEGTSTPFHPDYTITNSQQRDRLFPVLAKKINQNNMRLPSNLTVFPAVQGANAPQKYGDDLNQPSQRGYEYTHPQKVFNYNEGNNFKSHFSHPTEQDITYNPINEDRLINKGTIDKPLITPDVSFNYNSLKSDDSSNMRLTVQSINTPVLESGDSSVYRQNNNKFVPENTIFYSTDSVNDETREFVTRKPEYGTTLSGPHHYESPYTSKVTGDYPTSTLLSQYSSTTPLPSDSSGLTSLTNQAYYSYGVPSSQYSTTLKPVISSETFSPISRRPDQIRRVNDGISTLRPINSNGYRRTGYRNGPETSNDNKQSISNRPNFQDDLESEFKNSPSKYDGTSSVNERVNGEDFSGPKQPQRFDPERGYYY